MIKQLLLSAITIFIAAIVTPGVSVGIIGAVLTAIVFTFLNIFIKPLMVLITLPVSILTLGLFTLVINALLVLIAARIVPSFHVTGFWAALVFGIVLAIINILFLPKM